MLSASHSPETGKPLPLAAKAVCIRRKRPIIGAWGALIGCLGGLIGLGGAEFRLPVLAGVFRLPMLEAVILNKAMSLVVVIAALLFRSGNIPFDEVLAHTHVVFTLLAGSLVGAWWAAGHAMRMSPQRLNLIVMLMLVGLAALMLIEAWSGPLNQGQVLFKDPGLQFGAGVVAGFGIGVVAALLGVAGGELLIPTIVLLFGIDIKLAGSLSLMVSLPTMLVGFARYRDSGAFAVLQREQILFRWMAIGSILGAAIGGALLGLVPTDYLVSALGVILLISAYKTWRHAH